MVAEEEAGTPHDPDASNNVLPAIKPPAKKITTGVKEASMFDRVATHIAASIDVLPARTPHTKKMKTIVEEVSKSVASKYGLVAASIIVLPTIVEEASKSVAGDKMEEENVEN